MALSERDRRTLILGGVGLGTIGLYVLVVGPLWSRYDAMLDRHQRLAEQTARVVFEAERAEYMQGQVAEWEAKAGKLTPPKPYGEQITAVSDRIMTASQAGANVRNSNWSAPTPWPDDPTLQVAQVHLEAEADWENVFRFIAAVYRIEGVLSVEEMDLSSDPKRGGKVTIRLSVSVLIKAAQQGKGLWAG